MVILGYCYHPFTGQKFGEIGFLAISQTEDVCEYGTRLVDRTKERKNKLRLALVLTYANNNTVPYFEKKDSERRSICLVIDGRGILRIMIVRH